MSDYSWTSDDDDFIEQHYGKPGWTFVRMAQHFSGKYHRPFTKHMVRGRWLRVSKKDNKSNSGNTEWEFDETKSTRNVTFFIDLGMHEADAVIKSPEQLLERAGIDYDKGQWRIDRVKVGAWSTPIKSGSVTSTKGGVVTKKHTVIQVQNYKVNVSFVRMSPMDPQSVKGEILQEVCDLARTLSVKPVSIVNKSRSNDEYCLEIAFFDLHYGKLCWAAETSENYDIKIADKVVSHAVDDIVQKTAGYKFQEIVVPLGSDLLHIDTLAGTTTAGTRQDVDSRFRKIYARCRQMLIQQLLKLSRIAPVTVKVIPGNHDTMTSFTLGDALVAYVEGVKAAGHSIPLTIDNTPRTRKFYQFHHNLILFDHGHGVKAEHYPGIFLSEAPREALAMADNFHAHIGHTHRRKEKWFVAHDQCTKVTVRVLRSLSATDSWHFDNGYVGTDRCAEAIVWNRRGIDAEFPSFAPASLYA